MKSKVSFFQNFILVLGFGLFFESNLNAQWTVQTSPTTGELETVYFINSTTGFTSGAFNSMYKTTNGGTTWATVGSYMAKNIHFFDATTGYAAGVAGTGTMKKTINGGTTWTNLTAPNSSSVWGVFATSASTVYFITTDDYVQRSTNGGTSFTSSTLSNTFNLTDIEFTDANTGYVVDQSGKIWKTANGGTTWSNIANVTGISSLYAVDFVNSTTGFICGSNGKVFKSTDAGATWNALTTNISLLLYSIHFFDSNNGIAVGLSGTIIRTSNGGTTWTTETSNTTETLNSVFFISATSAVIVGENGVILKNSNINSIEENEFSFSIQIFPNPTTDILTITTDEILTQIEIFDINGKLVIELSGDNRTIDVSQLENGFYILKAISENGISEQKFICE